MLEYRIGQSTDIHQLEESYSLVIGGVNIEHHKGCVAHSDGDILVHAIGESILGALCLGDLGTHFSDTDPLNKDRSSLEMLEEIYTIMKSEGYIINNIDSLILIEEPKMKKYASEMKENISKILHIDINQINIKATRGEKIGFVGRKEGVVAQAVTMLKKDV
ncbi:MAG: 2-C-methyl-D-erythritol 2,4-cyclodiphosphate synthase [Erysipelotrichales bacterium]